jgi:hypothetical protein
VRSVRSIIVRRDNAFVFPYCRAIIASSDNDSYWARVITVRSDKDFYKPKVITKRSDKFSP